MNSHSPPPDPSAQIAIDPLPENLLRHPIDYLRADHLRLRRVCDLLDGILADPQSDASRASAKVILDYLSADLPSHVADEEQDLFPRLAARCRPSDRVDDLIRILTDEHVRNDSLLEAVSAALRALHETSKTHGLIPAGAIFAEAKRRHIAWENALILPLARARLGAKDLRGLGHGMATRRHIPYPA